MKQIYEITDPFSAIIPTKQISAYYPSMQLEGLIYILSHLFEKEFIVFAPKNILNSKINEFNLVHSSLNEALDILCENFESLDYRIHGDMVLLNDKNIIEDISPKSWLTLDIFQTDNSLREIKLNLFQVICYMANRYKKSIICETDSFTFNTYFKISINPIQKLGTLVQQILSQVWGTNVDCFESFLHFFRRKPNLLIN